LPLLEVKGLTSARLKLKDVSFRLSKGEVLGIAGLLGSGRTELLGAIFGIYSHDAGEIYIDGKPAKIRNPRDAIKKGLSLITEERIFALFSNLNLADNIVPVVVDNLSDLGWINARRYLDLATTYRDALQIVAPSVNIPVLTLSGGNQQKAIISRWLATNPKILLCDEPTNGIDVVTKEEIRRRIADLAARGVGVIYVSSDFDELLKVSTRIVIMSRGSLVREYGPGEVKNLSAERLLEEVYLYAAKEGIEPHIHKTSHES
jgi:ABC-type sugar transport system ATPase subunit